MSGAAEGRVGKKSIIVPGRNKIIMHRVLWGTMYGSTENARPFRHGAKPARCFFGARSLRAAAEWVRGFPCVVGLSGFHSAFPCCVDGLASTILRCCHFLIRWSGDVLPSTYAMVCFTVVAFLRRVVDVN